MSKLNISRLTNENEDGSPKITGITTFSSTAFLEAPKGTTAQRPSNPLPGAIRFNTDGGHLEYFTGEFWDEVLVANNTLDGGARGIFSGAGTASPTLNVLDYVTISTLGNAIDFGDLVGVSHPAAEGYIAGFSSPTRGVFAGGYNNAAIRYITISSTGNSIVFGDLTGSGYVNGCSSSTRGLISGGGLFTGSRVGNTIDYVTIASTGNAVDFGDLTVGGYAGACFASSTRAVRVGGTRGNVIDYVTISTTGNAIDFGDVSGYNPTYVGGLSNSTRGVFGGGYNVNIMEYVTIASTGNSTDFGDLLVALYYPSGCSSSTRGLFGGSSISGATPARANTINYITILSTGNAVDFGDLNFVGGISAAVSNGHGGL
jgi:hypothetical protein